MKEFRTESDLLGELQVPKEAFFPLKTIVYKKKIVTLQAKV